MRKEQDIRKKAYLKQKLKAVIEKNEVIETDKQENPIDKLNNPVCRKEERISELESICEKITQKAEQREKEMNRYEGKLKDAKIRMKLSNNIY